ncbi:Phage collar [Yersinia phage phiR8-01]|uniref:Phage collar n=1 Tax=Yersinia phage phiR8-01 TaxID=1206556 RepID=I7LGX7_9CAUD|nr:head-tail adaptor [Yersinia phage phiR8-01]CCI88424.1 Phage collar [Yersinia phage phiR8-01]
MDSARGRFATLESKRSGLLTRCERYAELTIRSVLPRSGYDEGQDSAPHDLQSVGAAAVNNLVNKMMLAMFAPSRPFMRYELPRKQKEAMLSALDLSEEKLKEALSALEMDSVKELDSIAARPKLYDLMTQLVVTGNALRYMDGDTMRILSMRNYVGRRNAKGESVEIIIREKVTPDDLDEEVRPFCTKTGEDEYHYRWFTRKGDRWTEAQYIGDNEITLDKYKGDYKLEDMPAHHHVWRLPDGSNYGIGHVEDFSGDFEGLSSLSEAELNGAILASEFRWLANPGGLTRPEDVETSENGDVIPGQEGDLVLVSAGAVANSIAVVSASADKWTRRIASGFLMTGGMQRDAERVTAEEIRLLASELETALGGVYSRLAVDLQLPLAYWLMNRIADEKFKKSDFKPVIITGLDALSRNGDLENVRLFVQDVIQITTLPPEVSARLRLDNIFAALASGRGLVANQFVKSEDETQQEQQGQVEEEQDRNLETIAAQGAAKRAQ